MGFPYPLIVFLCFLTLLFFSHILILVLMASWLFSMFAFLLTCRLFLSLCVSVSFVFVSFFCVLCFVCFGGFGFLLCFCFVWFTFILFILFFWFVLLFFGFASQHFEENVKSCLRILWCWALSRAHRMDCFPCLTCHPLRANVAHPPASGACTMVHGDLRDVLGASSTTAHAPHLRAGQSPASRSSRCTTGAAVVRCSLPTDTRDTLTAPPPR